MALEEGLGLPVFGGEQGLAQPGGGTLCSSPALTTSQLVRAGGRAGHGCEVMFSICFFNREEIEVLKRDKEQACFDLEELGTQVVY